ncbi:MAG: antitoxin VbhA family protein [Oscillospiraceae bacterium]|nr:antitoxin VbhA family protein [Oscillospiraceae bacterium]
MSGGTVVAKKNYTVSMKNAEASVRMEGYTVTPKMRNQCKQVLSGKTTTAECLRQFTVAKAAKVVK